MVYHYVKVRYKQEVCGLDSSSCLINTMTPEVSMGWLKLVGWVKLNMFFRHFRGYIDDRHKPGNPEPGDNLFLYSRDTNGSFRNT